MLLDLGQDRFRGELGQVPELVGGATAALTTSPDGTTFPWRQVMAGIVTGVTVHLVMRFLDRWLSPARR